MASSPNLNEKKLFIYLGPLMISHSLCLSIVNIIVFTTCNIISSPLPLPGVLSSHSSRCRSDTSLLVTSSHSSSLRIYFVAIDIKQLSRNFYLPVGLHITPSFSELCRIGNFKAANILINPSDDPRIVGRIVQEIPGREINGNCQFIVKCWNDLESPLTL